MASLLKPTWSISAVAAGVEQVGAQGVELQAGCRVVGAVGVWRGGACPRSTSRNSVASDS